MLSSIYTSDPIGKDKNLYEALGLDGSVKSIALQKKLKEIKVKKYADEITTPTPSVKRTVEGWRKLNEECGGYLVY